MITQQKKFINLVIMGILTCCMVFLTTQIVSSADKVRLRWMTQWSLETNARAFPEIIEKFEALHPNIEVDLSTGFTGFERKVRAEFLSKNPPDIASMNPYTIRPLIVAGAVYDLTNFFEELGWDEGYFYPVCDFSQKYLGRGRYYSAVGIAGMEGLWYNEGVFEKYGLQKPTNWNELMQVSEELKANDIIPIVCNAGDWAATCIQALLSAQITGFDNIIKGNTQEIPWTDEVFVKPLRIIMDLVEKDIYPASMTGVSMATAISLISTGKGAMHMGGSWFAKPFYDVAQELKREGRDFRYGLLTHLKFVPHPRNLVVGCCQGCFTVATKSKHMKEALELFKFYYQPENQELFAVRGMVTSPVMGVKTSPHVPKEMVECLPTLTEDSLFIHDYADPVAWDCDVMGDDIKAMMLGRISPEEVMQRAQKRYDEAHK